MERERDHNWFLSQKWVGWLFTPMGFAEKPGRPASTTGSATSRKLGIQHGALMPDSECPVGQEGWWLCRKPTSADR